MYTQCPECLTAFRVTAGLLQQASGRVRCGSCGHAFSALEHLSEDPPPVDDGTEDVSAGSDEAQDALLDTFTDLSVFDDIRIEDTGVEWRVVDEEETDESPSAEERDPTDSVRWFLAEEDEGPPSAPVVPLPELRDEVPADERPAEDAGIFVEESGNVRVAGPMPSESGPGLAIHDPQEALDLPHTDGSEPRYDDNTPLPDDFRESLREPSEADPPRRRATDHIEPRSPEFDERQADLELAAPEDWRELLEEFGAAGNAPPGPVQAAELPEEAHSDPSSDVPADLDTRFDLKALAMGIDVTGGPDGHATGRDVFDLEGDTDDEDTPAVELELEADTDRDPAAGAVDLEFEPGGDQATVDFDSGPTGSPAIDFQVSADDEAAATALDFDPGDEGGADESEFGFAEAFDASGTGHEEEEREAADREAALDSELDAACTPEEEPTVPSSPADRGIEVPPQTEEEMTINLQIDQDLLRLAAEEGFDSTLTGERRMPEDSLLVETIVMEGEFVRSALDKELDQVVETVGGVDDDPRLLLDTYIKSNERVRGGRRRTDPPSYTVVASLVVLSVLLMGQVVHAYRESLATYGGFDRTVGSIYRLFGASLVPEWNVRGWRFEATSGSTDQADEILTIRSRISNQSGGELPYPLLHVALTDRFEEVIGSRVLEPADYLADGEDTSSRLAAGEEFSATITVESLSSEATGFKLNVCYREDAARLRCATEDFRN